MKKANKEIIRNFYYKNGLRDTSKLTGLPTYEVIRILELPLTTDTSNTVLDDMLMDGKLPKIGGNIEIHSDSFDGVWYITSIHEVDDEHYGEMISMATPFWDNTNLVPIDSDYFKIIKKENDEVVTEYNDAEYDGFDVDGNFKDIKSLLEWYRDFYIPTLKSTLNKHASKNIERFKKYYS